ncbi:TatD family hydrolase [Quadrisphaera granulorum]|uniref:TatD family hydrolase n=1 Tax=Quadrisphaera granulorum TaxID=317664 RepID=UPI001FEBB4B6|nr:TatD family hydrolase [Quadrisphaera granulorum]
MAEIHDHGGVGAGLELPEGYPPVPEPLTLGPAGSGVGGVVDDHTHLDHLDDATVDRLLAAAAAAGVPRAVQIGCDAAARTWTDRAVRRWPQLLGGVAVHPNEAPELARAGQLDAALAEVERLVTGNDRIRVVGETGLDSFRTDWDDDDARRAQLDSFAAHIAIAKRTGRTLQIHDRDAHTEVLDVLRAEGAPDRVVFHCFSGDAAMAKVCADNGWYLSIAGTVTFKNNHVLREAVRAVPPVILQVETDAPYLTPVPYRGRPNASHLVPLTVRVIAEELRHDVSELVGILGLSSEYLYGQW